jgi:hypothetical protein
VSPPPLAPGPGPAGSAPQSSGVGTALGQRIHSPVAVWGRGESGKEAAVDWASIMHHRRRS